jgi:hypothetical protein
LISQLERIEAHIQQGPGDKKLKERVLGSIRNIRKARPSDRLKELARRGLVSPDGVKAWGSLRNQAAHARPPERKSLQQWIDDCHATTVLLYQIIFAAIGYRGRFTNYGVEKWPEQEYPLTAPEGGERPPQTGSQF